jgi:hypothetical protein
VPTIRHTSLGSTQLASCDNCNFGAVYDMLSCRKNKISVPLLALEAGVGLKERPAKASRKGAAVTDDHAAIRDD